MAVAVLLYHGTPAESRSKWDVPLDMFKRQIDSLLKQSTHFIRFQDVNTPENINGGRRLAITFDDGQQNNQQAVEYLAERQIRPTCFITQSWAQSGRGEFPWSRCMQADTIRQLAAVCDFGGHGVSHAPLTQLSDTALMEELRNSRDFLEQALGSPVTSMALPCGASNQKVMQACQVAGYDLVATTQLGPHVRREMFVNRIGVNGLSSVSYPSSVAQAGPLYWRARWARRRLIDMLPRPQANAEPKRITA